MGPTLSVVVPARPVFGERYGPKPAADHPVAKKVATKKSRISEIQLEDPIRRPREMCDVGSVFRAAALDAWWPCSQDGWARVESLTDVACLEAIASRRDREAFAVLYRRFAPRVRAYLLKRNADAATATDVTQDVMLTIWRKADSFDSSRASAASWVFTIARNRYIDKIRRRRRPEPDPEESMVPSERLPDREVDAARRHAELRDAIAGLPTEQRDLIVMAYIEGRSQSDIADATGLPLGTVKSRFRLAMKKLRERVAPPDSGREHE